MLIPIRVTIIRAIELTDIILIMVILIMVILIKAAVAAVIVAAVAAVVAANANVRKKPANVKGMMTGRRWIKKKL